MDMSIDPYTASHDDMVDAVLADLASVARLTDKQQAAHRAAPTGAVRARVVIGQALDGVAPADRHAVWDRLYAEGRIWLVGKGTMRHPQA